MVSDPVVTTFFKQADVIKWLNEYAPVGCRDTGTVEFFKSIGVEAYFSGCPTLTYTRRKDIPRQNYILLITCNY